MATCRVWARRCIRSAKRCRFIAGQNEQSMGFAAAAYAKYHLRRRFMFCTASAGPGTANLLTAAALAHANRLPMLMLCGDTFLTRLPDPVLQQLEHFGNPTLGRERCLQGRQPLLGPDHPPGADPAILARRACHAA